MSEKRFYIIDGPDYCYLKDTKGELATLPLMFQYEHLSEENKNKLQKWVRFLNE